MSLIRTSPGNVRHRPAAHPARAADPCLRVGVSRRLREQGQVERNRRIRHLRKGDPASSAADAFASAAFRRRPAVQPMAPARSAIRRSDRHRLIVTLAVRADACRAASCESREQPAASNAKPIMALPACRRRRRSRCAQTDLHPPFDGSRRQLRPLSPPAASCMPQLDKSIAPGRLLAPKTQEFDSRGMDHRPRRTRRTPHRRLPRRTGHRIHPRTDLVAATGAGPDCNPASRRLREHPRSCWSTR